MEYKFLIAILCIAATASASIGAGAGVNITAYGDAQTSGFNHGVSDCEKYQNGNNVDLYITGYNSKGKSTGPAHHTDKFNNAYLNGWTSEGCTVNQFYSLDFTNDKNVYVWNDNANNNNVNAYRESFNDNEIISQPQSQSANTVQSNQCPSQIINGDCIVGQEQSTKNHFAQANRGEID